MSELWMPGPKLSVDVENVFDMMELFQQELDAIRDREKKIRFGLHAATTLSYVIHRAAVDDLEISLSTDFAILQRTSERSYQEVLGAVGIVGRVVDANIISLGEVLPPSVAMEVDVEHVFNPSEPEETAAIFGSGNVPIGSVNYIERGGF